MTFWQYLQASKTIDLQGMTELLGERFVELAARGHSVADLVGHFADEFGHLPIERLRRLSHAHRSYQTWRKRKTQLEEARKKAQLAPLPEEVFVHAPQLHQLDALYRAARLVTPEIAASEARTSGVLEAGVEIWTQCFALALQQGLVRSQVVDSQHPEAGRYDAYVRVTETLAEVAPHRWFAMRRGEREGVLKLELELPRDAMAAQVELRKGRLGPVAAERTASSLLEELVLDDLAPWLLKVMDQDAEAKAIAAASESLGGLLRSAPVQARRLGAVYLTRAGQPAALVVTDREGELLFQKVWKAEGSWIQRLQEAAQEQEANQIALPTSCPSPELAATLEAQLAAAGLQIVKVRSAAINEAKQPLMAPPQRLSTSVAAALVLARRALDPLKEWSAIDPVSIGIAEYQNELDADRLRAALTEAVELCRLERRRGKATQMGAPVTRGGAAIAKLNPLVKNLGDLRPGMTVHGVVTNISHFGAFVNLGLSEEGLVHISELSDEFVTNPNEVVSIGQQVTAQVLSVDGPRRRISLSLKTQRAQPGLREGRGEGRGDWRGDSRSSSANTPRTKAEALANLERLFKK
ncbi:MAG: S1 RNA-binding domain-containing protein [Deltaproteobacteria bacterium]|nr:S1 RNA-binding domain-containing protein [Deltaproteobacteria bacterium]